jgi:outer membrane protein, adhesin transport system
MRRLGWATLALFVPLATQAQSVGNLITSALQSHPAIRSQQAQMQGAKAGVEGAAWQYYPTPSVSVDQGATAASGDTLVSTLRLQQPLWTGGRLTAGSQKAQAQFDVNTAQLQETRQQLALQVVQAYGDWLAGYLKLQVQDKTLAVHQRLLDQVKRRIAQGQSSDSDATQAQTRLSLIAADMALAQAQTHMALTKLAQLIGRQPELAALVARIAPPRPVAAQAQPLLEAALSDNPGIQKAQAQALLMKAGIAEREADLSPELYVRAERIYGNQALGFPSPNDRFYLGLSSKFGAGLSNQSDIQGASARHQAALADVETQKLSVSAQVLADHALALASLDRQTALAASLQAAEQVGESYDRQFLAGRKTWLDVMNAAREVAQAQTQMADIQASLVIIGWRLALYTEPLARVTQDTP